MNRSQIAQDVQSGTVHDCTLNCSRRGVRYNLQETRRNTSSERRRKRSSIEESGGIVKMRFPLKSYARGIEHQHGSKYIDA